MEPADAGPADHPAGRPATASPLASSGAVSRWKAIESRSRSIPRRPLLLQSPRPRSSRPRGGRWGRQRRSGTWVYGQCRGGMTTPPPPPTTPPPPTLPLLVLWSSPSSPGGRWRSEGGSGDCRLGGGGTGKWGRGEGGGRGASRGRAMAAAMATLTPSPPPMPPQTAPRPSSIGPGPRPRSSPSRPPKPTQEKCDENGNKKTSNPRTTNNSSPCDYSPLAVPPALKALPSPMPPPHSEARTAVATRPSRPECGEPTRAPDNRVPRAAATPNDRERRAL